MTRRHVSAFAIALCASGCDSCEEKNPYTPFGVASSLPPGAADGPSKTPPDDDAGIEPDAGPPLPRRADVAPRAATRWTLGERERRAPAGRIFERGLAADFDGNGELDAVAWTVPTADAGPTSPAGELWLFAGDADGRRILGMPSFLPTGPGCRIEADVTQTGPRTVTVDVRSRCETTVLAGTPTRALAVLAPSTDAPLVVGLRIDDPPPGEKLDFTATSTDRDGDGRDDVEIATRLDTGNEELTLPLRWFDRATGAARDTREPAATLAARASVAQVRAAGEKTSRTVPSRIDAVRRAFGDLCGESKTARVTEWDGTPLPCGDTSLAVTRLARASVEAALTRDDPREAFAALARLDWYGGSPDEKVRAELERAILERVAVREVAPAEPVSVRPAVDTSAPRYSPLAFDVDGALLVRGSSSLTRVDPSTREETRLSADAGIEPWSLAVTGPRGRRWRGVSYPCHRSGVLLLLEGPDGVPVDPLETNVLAPRPGGCGGGSTPTALPASPLRWTEAGLAALVAGSQIGSPTADATNEAPRGTPWSPDGKHLVSTTTLGLLITGPPKAALWRASALGDPRKLTDCVVANGASTVACVAGGRARVFRPR